MGYDKECLNKAVSVINQRRISARSTKNIRMEEIEEKIPEITEVLSEIANTSIEISKLILNKTENIEIGLEKIKNKNIEAQAYVRDLLIKNGYPEDYLQEHFVCDECQDTGFINGRRCRCFNDLIQKYEIEKLNESSQMKLCSFETFNLDYYPKEDGCYYKMSEIYCCCKEYADAFTKHSNSIFMYGGTGLGKTHLSLSIAKQVIEKGYNVAYDSIINYLRIIEKEHFSKSQNDADTLQTLLNADLLILDDLGSEFESSFYVSGIYNIINTRLNRNVPIIINTNLTANGIRNRYEERIVSRLFSYDCFKFCGNDIRQIKRSRGEI